MNLTWKEFAVMLIVIFFVRFMYDVASEDAKTWTRFFAGFFGTMGLTMGLLWFKSQGKNSA